MPEKPWVQSSPPQHSAGQRRSLLDQLWDQDEAFHSPSFSPEEQGTSPIKRTSWNDVYSNPHICFQYKVILLKLLHWREERRNICAILYHPRQSEAERDAHNWMVREFLLSYSSGVPKLLLPSQLLLIHFSRHILVVRTHFGWELTERNEEICGKEKPDAAFSQRCL